MGPIAGGSGQSVRITCSERRILRQAFSAVDRVTARAERRSEDLPARPDQGYWRSVSPRDLAQGPPAKAFSTWGCSLRTACGKSIAARY